MEDLKKLLDSIGIEDQSMYDGKIENIKRLDDGYCFNIKLNKPIHTINYDELCIKVKKKFSEFKNIDVKLVCENNYIEEYYLYFIDKYAAKDTLYRMFKDCNVAYSNGEFNIEVDQESKKKS